MRAPAIATSTPAWKRSVGPGDGHFERRDIGGIVDERVGAGEGARVHGAGRRNADVPQLEPAGKFLKARLRAGHHDIDVARQEHEVA